MQPKVEAGTPTAGQRFPAVYTVGWALAGLLSLAYLAEVALSGADQSPRVAATSPDNPAVAAAEARAARLKATLEDFQRDIAALRRDGPGHGIEAAAEARLAALEERLAIETGVAVSRIAAATEKPPLATRVAGAIATEVDGQTRIEIPLETGSIEKAEASRTAPAGPSAEPPAPLAAATAPVDPTPAAPAKPAKAAPVAPKVVATVPAKPSPTAAPAVPATQKTAQPAAPTPPAEGKPLPGGFAAVVTPGASPPAAQQPTPPKPFALQLASATSRNDLRDSWMLLEAEHGETLRNLSPRVAQSQATPESGPIYDLLAGPFRSAADAKKACKALAARGVDCKVGNYTGDAL